MKLFRRKRWEAGVPGAGQDSGRNALKQTLRELGYDPSDVELAEVYARVTTFADQSKDVRARDVMAIAHEGFGKSLRPWLRAPPAA
jgi:isopropylmalate/homocitrate/citramalate synthase